MPADNRIESRARFPYLPFDHGLLGDGSEVPRDAVGARVVPFLLEVPGVVGVRVWGRERRVSVAHVCREIERESRRAYLWSSSTSKPALPSMRTEEEDPMLNIPMPLLSSSRALETNSKLEAFCSHADDDEGDGGAERLSAKLRAGGLEKGLPPPGSRAERTWV